MMGCKFRSLELATFFIFKGGIVNKELKIARIRAGFSQYKLSRITGISQSLLSVFEQGYRRPTVEQVKLIADALKTSEYKIFPETKEGNRTDLKECTDLVAD